ncbi:hypothetical protein [Microlunatus sp. GCM10028923]|uniref:hypothetical protein n=1 Tax=Microlunatus sp. GCM10028923 TaxID=3273400 RepID=UPI003671F997
MTTPGPALDADRLLLRRARSAGDAAYDPDQKLITGLGSVTSVHTALAGRTVHPYRESATFALTLLETGDAVRAAAVIDAVLAGQDRDPQSETYGVWPYYLEEPLPAMRRPDPNWADFLGQELALIMLRHRAALSSGQSERVGATLRAAVEAIIRRNVAMSYTNIAAKGTFVALAAGQLLADPELADYGRGRLERLAAIIEDSGSFAEYNSPTYWLVTRTALSAIGQLITDSAVAERATGLVHLLWRHLAARWHRPTGQLTGPMSRTYTEELAESPVLLATIAKAVAGRPPFDRLPTDTATTEVGDVATAILQSDAPAEVIERFAGPAAPDLHRERFERGRPDRIGTSWLGRSATLGSVNFADAWFQRRNLLGFWTGDPDGPPWQRPTSFLRLRVIKDDADFVSGVFSATQDGQHVLWHVGLASPGGDRHVYRDDLPAGLPFPATSIRVRLEVRLGPVAEIRIDGSPAAPGDRFTLGQRVTVTDDGTMIDFRPGAGRWGEDVPGGEIVSLADDRIGLDVIMVDAGRPHPVVLTEVGTAFLGGTVSLIEDGAEPSALASAEPRLDGDLVHWHWPAAQLALTARSAVGARADHAAAHDTGHDRLPS